MDDLDQKLNTHVAVLGGGYAGLSAAVRLAGKGIKVSVFESAKQLGGRARGLDYQNTRLDNGQHLLLGCYHHTLAMIETVGGNLEQDFLRLPLQLDLHGHFSLKAPRLPAPLHLLYALLSAQGLSLAEKIGAARFMQTLKRTHFKLAQDTTVYELLSEHSQSAALIQKFWEPLCIAALNTPMHKASAQVLLNVLRDSLNGTRADSDMLLPKIDFTSLFPSRAAAYIEARGGSVRCSCGVESITQLADGFEVVAGSTHLFSHVICALPPVAASRLLSSLPELSSVVAEINALEQQPITTLYLQYPPHVRLPHPMTGLHQRISQWLFDKGQISGEQGLIASVISAEGAHTAWTHEELTQRVVAELRCEFRIEDEPRWVKVVSEKRATFSCTPNLARPAQRTPLTNLFLAGDYTAGDYPATLEGAVQSGLLCADLISTSIQGIK